MAFLDDLSKKVGKAAQAAVKKSNELVEITKLNAHISSIEDRNKVNYQKIGEICFEQYTSGHELSESIAEFCKQITENQAAIKDLQSQVETIKTYGAASTTYTGKASSEMDPFVSDAESDVHPSASQVDSSSINLDK